MAFPLACGVGVQQAVDRERAPLGALRAGLRSEAVTSGGAPHTACQLPGAFRLGGHGRWLVHRAVFEEGVERLARGQTVTPQQPEALLERAYDDLSRRRAART
jgi:hypothetical protein